MEVIETANKNNLVEYYRMDDNLNNLINKILIIQQGDYRINDIINKKGRRWEYSGKNVLSKNKYDDMILKKYLQINGLYQKINLETLLTTIENHTELNRLPCPTENELVMHLRLGDYEQFAKFLKKNYIEEIRIFLDKHPNIDKLTIVTAFSYGTWSKDSLHLKKDSPSWSCTKKTQEKNITNVTKVVKQIITEFPNLLVDIKSSNNIDEDFSYCIMSKYYIYDIGGFSKLVYELNKLRLTKNDALKFTV